MHPKVDDILDSRNNIASHSSFRSNELSSIWVRPKGGNEANSKRAREASKHNKLPDAKVIKIGDDIAENPSSTKKPTKREREDPEHNEVSNNKARKTGADTKEKLSSPEKKIELDPNCIAPDTCDYYAMSLEPEESSSQDPTNVDDQRFTQSFTAAFPPPLTIYEAAKEAMHFYRAKVVNTATVEEIPATATLTITKEGINYKLIQGGTSLIETPNPMDVWNKLAFYGSYRHMGEWIPSNDLFTKSTFDIVVKMRNNLAKNPDNSDTHDHKVWVSCENSYTTLAKFTSGKPYPALTGSINTEFNRDYMDTIHLYGYHLYDQAILTHYISTQKTTQELAALETLYGAGIDNNAKLTLINDQIRKSITPKALASCYKLFVDTNTLPTKDKPVLDGCNIRAFELFTAVVIAETHRNSYTAVINAAMLDLFAANYKYTSTSTSTSTSTHYTKADFWKFLAGNKGQKDIDNTPWNHYGNKHNMAFSGAAKCIDPATGQTKITPSGDEMTLGWYQAKDQSDVLSKEKEVTRNWEKLLHDYECWLLTKGDLDSIGGDGKSYIATITNTDPNAIEEEKKPNTDSNAMEEEKKPNTEEEVNLGESCPLDTKPIKAAPAIIDFSANTEMRPEFKIYAAYRVAQKLNSWSGASNDANILETIVTNVFGSTSSPPQTDPKYTYYQQLFNSISNCINDDATAGTTHACYAVSSNPINLELCKDIYCGLLAHNTMDYA